MQTNTALFGEPFGLRNFSSSSYHQKTQPPFHLSQYINPDSTRAHQALLVHRQNKQQNSRRFKESYKTVMCENWLEKAECNFGKNCRFAHGFEDIRPSSNPPPINSKYKTRICEKYTKRGICPYGHRCLFIHPDTDNPPPSSPQIVRHQPSSPPSSLVPIQSLLFWTPSGPNPPQVLPRTPHGLFDSSIPDSSVFSTAFAHSFPMVLPSKNVYGNNQDQRKLMENFEGNGKNKRPNLFPQIYEDLQREREKENSTPMPSSSQQQWTEPDVDAYDHQKEMEEIVEKLVKSPLLMDSLDRTTDEDCELT